MSYRVQMYKSIQTGTVVIATGAATGTATITAVTVGSAQLIWNGATTNEGANIGREAAARITLTNSTTITATRIGTSGTVSVTVRFTIIDYRPELIKSMQYGVVTITGGPGNGTATITAVVTAKSAVYWLGFATTDNAALVGFANYTPDLALTNTTTVTASWLGNSFNLTVGFVVLESR